jgi:hypothetical protein
MPKIGEYEVVIKKGDKELETIPNDLPVFDFEGNQITMKEAQEGYMRTADYTKKTQSVAEVKKFLMEDLGFQDSKSGVAVMRQVLDTLSDLEAKGIYDSRTGEVKIPQSKKIQKKEGDDSFKFDEDGNFTLGYDHLDEDVKRKLNRLEQVEKDMSSLLGYLSRKEIRESYEDLSEEEIERMHKLAAVDPSKSPMEHAVAYVEAKKEWGQKAVDAYVEELKKPKDEGHQRPGSGEPAVEIFGERPIFSYDPGEHAEGANVINPSEAASRFLEAAMKEITGE